MRDSVDSDSDAIVRQKCHHVVVVLLQANLPLLQRELLHCARLAKQTPQQYLAHNEHILFDPAHAPRDSVTAQLNDNGKRKSPDRWARHDSVTTSTSSDVSLCQFCYVM